MKTSLQKSIIGNISLFIILLVGAISGSILKSLLTLFIFLIFGLFLYKKEVFKIQYPRYFLYYLLFLACMLISVIWSQNQQRSITLFIYFFSGAVFWVLGYNFINSKLFSKIIIATSLVLGLLSIIAVVYFERIYIPQSLIFYAVEPRHHHHIGDLWIITLIFLALSKSKNRKDKLRLPLIFFGMLLLTISLSRSAYLGLAVGSLYLFLNKEKYGLVRQSKTILMGYIAMSVILFLYASTQKSTLMAHYAYYGIGITSSLNNPLGLGMGTFDFASKYLSEKMFGIPEISGTAHNLIFEITTGMGLLGISFIIWLYLIMKSLLINQNRKLIVVSSMSIALFANFMTDYTYMIPTLFWIWFATLGLLQRYNSFKI